jgi:hypothetical protein
VLFAAILIHYFHRTARKILRKGLSVKKVSAKEHIEERLNRLLNEYNQLRD